MVELALEQSELYPRELAKRFANERGCFVSDPKGGEANPRSTACSRPMI